MARQEIDVTNHVRYVIALTRVATDGTRYTAMKTSIEVVDAVNEEKVRDSITRAIRREMYHTEDRETLAKDAVALVWEWLEDIRHKKYLPKYFPVIWRGNLVVCAGTHYIPLIDDSDYLQVNVFTKEDEEAVGKLFSKT